MKEPNRQRKGEIGQLIQLNDEQKEAIRLIRENQITIITGRAGCGKSLVSAHYAVDVLSKGECDRIFITRPTVEVGKGLGFLPGDLNSKMDPWFEAFLDNVYSTIKDKSKYNKWIEEERFRYNPIQYIRGKTFSEPLIIEESQSTTKEEMKAIITRLGKSGKIILNGDMEQCDLKTGEKSGLAWLLSDILPKVEEIKRIDLKTNHRSPLVQKILEIEYGK